MQLRKYQYHTGLCVIKSDTYNNTFDYIKLLVAEAKKDFPGLTDTDIHVVVFEGDVWRYQTAIEFKANNVPGYFIETEEVGESNFKRRDLIKCSHKAYQYLG